MMNVRKFIRSLKLNDEEPIPADKHEQLENVLTGFVIISASMGTTE